MYDVSNIEINGTSYAVKDVKAARKGMYVGTCTTAANTYAKVATVDTFPVDGNGKPLEGTIVGIKYSNSNSYKTAGQYYTLNVNNTGAYRMYYNNAELATSTSANTLVAGYKNRYIYYMFDDDHWVWLTASYETNSTYAGYSFGLGLGVQDNASASATITVTLASYALGTGGVTSVRFLYDVPANSTMNINSKGAKSIYYKNAAIGAGVINAGDTATFVYSGQYHLIAIDRWDDDIKAKANSADLAAVATSGSYNDLTNKPTIPAAVTVDSSLTGSSQTNPVQGGAIYSALQGKEDKKFVINLTYSNSAFSADKTPVEIYEAYQSGKTLLVKNGPNFCTLSVFSGNSTEMEAVFFGIDTTSNYILGYSFYAYYEDGELDTEEWLQYDSRFVPQTRKVNNKALSSDITLTASDVGALPSNTAIPTVVNNLTTTTTGSALDATQGKALKDTVDTKADKVTIVTVSTTGAVTQALDPNKFYDFTGSPTSLTLTLNSGNDLCIYAGKFTAGTGFSNLTLPSTVKVADGAPSVEAGGVYEFSVMNNLLLLAKEGS